MALIPQSTIPLCCRTMATSEVDRIVVEWGWGGRKDGCSPRGCIRTMSLTSRHGGNDSQGWSAPPSHLV